MAFINQIVIIFSSGKRCTFTKENYDIGTRYLFQEKGLAMYSRTRITTKINAQFDRTNVKSIVFHNIGISSIAMYPEDEHIMDDIVRYIGYFVTSTNRPEHITKAKKRLIFSQNQ